MALSTANSSLEAATEQLQSANSKNIEVKTIPPTVRRAEHPATGIVLHRQLPSFVFADCCIFFWRTQRTILCHRLLTCVSPIVAFLSVSQLERENQRLVSEVARLEDVARRTAAQTAASSGTPKSSSPPSSSPRVLQQLHGPPGGGSGISAHAARRGDAVSHPSSTEFNRGWRSRALLEEAFALWGEHARFMRMSGLRERFSSLNWFVGTKGGVLAELGNVPVGRLTKQVMTLLLRITAFCMKLEL